ncbi:MAG: molybdenum cofactor biosynthesis protein MoaE [Sphingomonadales bacterium]|nr:molybdenum cofactor biosynthesis protein MoaE [Sphingomonadales bacterium]
MGTDVRLLATAFDPAAELSRFTAAHAESGGVVSFLGQVRHGGGVELLELRHYAPLTLPGMDLLAMEATARWPLGGMLVIHRTGEMAPGEPIVLVAAAARHRRDAFMAAEFAMDHLKSESWFWKRERVDGAWRWIEPRDEDYADMERWA